MLNIKKTIDGIKFSLIVVPEGAKSKVVSKQYGFRSVTLFFVLAFTLITLMYFLLYSYTPLNYLIPQVFRPQSAEQMMIDEMNVKMNKLIKDLEEIQNQNERLKRIILGKDTVSQDTVKAGGSVYLIFKRLFNKYFSGKEPAFITPLSGFISQEFKPESGHYGIDIAAKTGSPFVATENGYVIFADFTVNYGFTLIIGHNNNYISIYKHCSALLKTERDFVMQGEIIGLIGNTGKHTTGPHLHFEIWQNGTAIDPSKVILNK